MNVQVHVPDHVARRTPRRRSRKSAPNWTRSLSRPVDIVFVRHVLHIEAAQPLQVPPNMVEQMHAISVDLQKADTTRALEKYNKLVASSSVADVCMRVLRITMCDCVFRRATC